MIATSEVVSISFKNGQTIAECIGWMGTDVATLRNYLTERVNERPDLITDELGTYGGGYFADQVARMRNIYVKAGVDAVSMPELPEPYRSEQRQIIKEVQRLIRQIQVTEYLCMLSTVFEGFEPSSERWRIETDSSVVEASAEELAEPYRTRVVKEV